MTNPIEQLRWQCNAWGIELEDPQLAHLSTYAELLAAYRLANVIGTKEREIIVLDHLLDSLSCLTVEHLSWGDSLVDVGSGGGLPGIPLAIVRPELHVTLLETTEKKIRFLQHVRDKLCLPNLTVLHARAEEAGWEPDYRDAFTLATSRALASLSVVVEYCAPLLRARGRMLAMKGKLPQDELSDALAAASKLSTQFLEIRKVTYGPHLPQKDRHLVLFDKVGQTPDRFPRRVGIAKRRPIRP